MQFLRWYFGQEKPARLREAGSRSGSPAGPSDCQTPEEQVRSRARTEWALDAQRFRQEHPMGPPAEPISSA